LNNRKIGLLKTADSEIVKVQMCFKNGSSCEPIKENGYVHLLEHIKIANNPFKELWFSKKMLTGVTTKEFLKFSYFVQKKELLKSVSCFIDNLLDYKFDEHIVNEQKQQVINELNYYNGQRTMKIINKSIDSIFIGNSLSNCSGGVTEVVKHINERQLIDYNKMIIEESGFVLSCVGDIDEDFFAERLEELLCNNFKMKIKVPFPKELLSEKRRNITSINKDRYSEFLVTYVLPGRMKESYIYTKIIEILIRNILSSVNRVNIKLYSFSHQSILMIYVISEKKDDLKLILKRINSKMNSVFNKEKIEQAIEAFRIQLFYDNTSLNKKSDYYTESILYGYDLIEKISSFDNSVLVYNIQNTIKEMISEGSVSVVLTEDIMSDEEIIGWELKNEMY